MRDVLTKYLSIVIVVMAKHFESAVTSASESLGSFGVLKTSGVCLFVIPSYYAEKTCGPPLHSFKPVGQSIIHGISCGQCTPALVLLVGCTCLFHSFGDDQNVAPIEP